MISTKKLLLSLSCVALVNTALISADSEPGLAEQMLSKAQKNRYANLATRIIAKSAMGISTKNVASSLKLDATKAFANATLEEMIPQHEEASTAEKHLDLLVPVAAAGITIGQKNNYYIDAESWRKTAIDLLKKESGKGFFVNKDFQQLKTSKDVAFFIADCATELLNNKREDKGGEKNKNKYFYEVLSNSNDQKTVLKAILNSKFITPLIMNYLGNQAVTDISRIKNKNALKAIIGLVEKHIVGKAVEASLQSVIDN